MASHGVSAEKRFRVSLLLDTYGELLTDKQSTFLRRYYEDDFSFGEIAEEFEVSRQAIFDAVKHGEAQLERYERVLGLVGAGLERGVGGQPAAGSLAASAARLGELAEAVRGCADRIGAGESDAEATVKDLSRIGDEIEALSEAFAREGERAGLREAAPRWEAPEAEDDEPETNQAPAAGQGSLLLRRKPEVD